LYILLKNRKLEYVYLGSPNYIYIRCLLTVYLFDFFSDCAEKTPSKAALDDDTSKRLWELSEKMVSLYNEK